VEPEKDIDFEAVGEATEAGAQTPLVLTPQTEAAAIFAAEIAALDQGKRDFAQEESNLKLEQLEVDVTNAKQAVILKEKFSGQILLYLWVFSGFCGVVLLLQGFSVCRFNLDTPVLVTLVGGTAASAFGLVSVVLGGLFRNPVNENRKAPKNGS
jgi:hypothetical protein